MNSRRGRREEVIKSGSFSAAAARFAFIRKLSLDFFSLKIRHLFYRKQSLVLSRARQGFKQFFQMCYENIDISHPDYFGSKRKKNLEV